jgi:MFS family permease
MTSTPRIPPASARSASVLAEAPSDLRAQLRTITVAWMFGTVWLYIVTGAAWVQFARSFGVTDRLFGVFAALSYGSALFQLPASYFLDRHGGRKSTFIVFATISRLIWIFAAVIPFVLHEVPDWWLPTLLGALLVSWATGNYSGPAWMNWMADVVPRRVRGRYFSTRARWTQPVGIVTMLLVGFVLDWAETRDALAPGTMLRVTSLLMALAGFVGTIDIQCFTTIPDAGPRHHPPRGHFLERFKRPLQDRSFRRFLAYGFTLMLGIGFLGQYMTLLALDVIKLHNWQVNLVLVAIPLAVYSLSAGVWGRLIDRFGKKPVLVVAAALFVAGPWGWSIATPERWIFGYVLTLVSPLAWAGTELAGLNIILDLSTPASAGKGSRQDGGSAYVAWNSVVAAIGGVLSGLAAAWVAGRLKGWTWTAPWGVQMHYHHVLLAISSFLRLLAVGWALSLTEPRATGTRDVIRTVSWELWSNVLQLVTIPAAVVGRMQRSSYRIDRPRPRPRK